MRARKLSVWLVAGAIAWAGAVLSGSVAMAADPAPLDDAGCLACHDGKKGELTITGANGKPRPLHPVAADKFGKSVHAKLKCVACHTDIVDNTSPHKKADVPKADCASCHQGLWERVQQENRAESQKGLGQVAGQIERYKLSVHAKVNADDKTRNNAMCADCHDSHAFVRLPEGSPERAAWRLAAPAACGTCHEEHLEEYTTSVHGKTVLEKKDPKGAICSDCHNPHGVDSTSKDEVKLGIVKACSSCHTANAKSYVDTYHGQITTLGYANTAKCFDCHGSHGILSPSDPKSKVHPDNRLETCKKCHKEATAGFVTYQPHAHAGDFSRYPQVWLTTKFMIGLLAGTFAFFWIHVVLWLYRESKDRKEGKARPLVQVDKIGIPPGKQFQRFGPWWRLGHLLFAVSLMILTLTGMTLLYSGSSWAPVVMRMLGGPAVASIIHRVCAVIFTGVFVVHLIYIIITIGGKWRTFKIFGPDSLIPGLQDLNDVIAMFKWFFGKGPRPFFDRWTYWEKFDYWAPFWGVAIVGLSGFMMWFPNVTAHFLPGWAFNVAVITHGEEAFLAAVFLFTVHFFNNHFRPEKFPLDVVMFTGAMSLEHFARDHPLHYKRLVETGELQKYLVDAPSKPMAIGSKILGFVLIAFGLLLLGLIANGFWGSVTH
ncbi:MAG: cytochrome c3 family protein [Betaproteobacteria bacterium]|nr:cytochrome c3 family protein [Betaproteobacteria bacterium]